MDVRRSWLIAFCGLAVSGLLARGEEPLPGPATAASPPARNGKWTARDVEALTERIDRAIAAGWAEASVTPAPPADDAEFLRRASLDVIGKIPTPAEVRAFLDDPAPDKRARLIERLLESPAYVTHFTRVWRGLLIPEADTDLQIRFLALDFDAWLRTQVAENAGYDKLARGLIEAPMSSNGQRMINPYDGTNGSTPIAFYVAKEAKPENLAAATARLFLGVRIECAQCHDHPFAKWKRDQFWGYAAFFGGIEKTGEENQFGPFREVSDRRELPIPGTERVAQASFLNGDDPQWKYRVGSRSILADWMTAADNPYFARAGVNRLWSHFFGLGLVEPVDDLGDDRAASHPELFQELARRFAASGYDIKFLIRAVTASRAYQLGSSNTTGTAAEDPSLLSQMPIKGMTPHQLYDSLARATGQVDRTRGGNLFQNELNSPRTEFLQKFARHDEKLTDTQTSILQSLALMNGRFVTRGTNPAEGPVLAAILEAPFLDTTERVEALFLAALGRKPRGDEASRMIAYVDRGGSSGNSKAALADLFWAMLNSSEFMFNH